MSLSKLWQECENQGLVVYIARTKGRNPTPLGDAYRVSNGILLKRPDGQYEHKSADEAMTLDLQQDGSGKLSWADIWLTYSRQHRQIYEVSQAERMLGPAYAIREGLLVKKRDATFMIIPYCDIGLLQIHPPLRFNG